MMTLMTNNVDSTATRDDDSDDINDEHWSAAQRQCDDVDDNIGEQKIDERWKRCGCSNDKMAKMT